MMSNLLASHPVRPVQIVPSDSRAATPDVAALLESATRRRFAARTLILQEGEPPDRLYFIIQGSVTVAVENDDGEELILAYLGPGQFFGELGLFDGAAGRSASVYARTDCHVATVTYERLHTLIGAEPKLLGPLATQIARRLRAASQKLGSLAFLDVTGRVARALLELARDSQATAHPKGALVRITREELGRLVNCSRKMAGRVLADLQARGLIDLHGKSIVVYDEKLFPKF